MPLSNYALDTFVSQKLSELCECRCRALESEFSGSEYWVSNFVTTQIFRLRLDVPTVRFAFAFLRRAVALLDAYGRACFVLQEFVGAPQKSPSKYFQCLDGFESAVAMLYQAYDLGRRFVGRNLFQPDDGSSLQRLNQLYNDCRHFGLDDLPGGHLHAVWISNDGIHSSKASLSFEEVEAMIREIASLARIFAAGEINDLVREVNSKAKRVD